ncbi:poly-beta-1,6-N-acetyl-D-glucosamine N-deacetylase PgaB [Pigmentiphaga aceris]|uniref:Poly-beta-1,6-N-acetyl-D-glucosamine N-deacetylase PgaB n=2 Tax=Pigmentiphaga aceris TaxID=1940612 RepID=A0A5C0B450_9BURK|nr:poly-beta-1,6-N-acetyl-D-glucosamine N-deacetylase PgaB [Pigmentiphaga aceris]
MNSCLIRASARRIASRFSRHGVFAALLAFVLIPLALSPLTANAQRLPPPDPEDGQTFRVVALHDIRTNVLNSFETSPEPTALDEKTLADWFAWLQSADYHPISVQQIVDARAGGKPLPPRAILLTFDDGYVSFYTKVFPLLKRFQYPALIALVTDWMESPAGQPVKGYGGLVPPPRENFMTWAQAREMAASGLVEFASHSDSLHTGLPGNPQGNLQPAAVTRVYRDGTYEDEKLYQARIETDLRRSRALIQDRTGTKVRAMVWPYGAYNRVAQDAAAAAGMPLMLTLDEGPNTPDVPLSQIRRSLATYDMPVPDFSLLRMPAGAGAGGYYPQNRAMHIDLDYIYDPDPVQQEANLSRLLDRVQAIGPRSVFLQAFADPDGDGVADAMYFPNRHLPVRADLFNRVAWQLRTRTGVQVYAWMPVMAFHLPAENPLATHTVTWLPDAPSKGRYARLSPFDPAVRTLIGEIYEDLGRYTNFAGLLFHDDAMLADDEDTSPHALATYAKWGLPTDIKAIRADPALSAQWAKGKTRFLTDFTLELAARVREQQPGLLTARNLFALPLMQPESETWFAQNYVQALSSYDYTAVMAMPYMEQAENPEAWLRELAQKVIATPGGLDRTIFELQTRDWRDSKPVPDATLAAQWSMLHRMGARHLAWYPDDFLNDQPGLDVSRNALSIRANLAGEVDTLETPPALAPSKQAPPADDRLETPGGMRDQIRDQQSGRSQ